MAPVPLRHVQRGVGRIISGGQKPRWVISSGHNLTGVDFRPILRAHLAYVASDNPWQARARLMQSLWRERQELPAGSHRDELLGSRIPLAHGEPPLLANYMTAAAKDQVQRAVADSNRTGALLARPRLWVDLLSSQPLCFNLFGDLAGDLVRATKALQRLWPDIDEVTSIRFEFSPGRRNPQYTGNRSAFDVFVEYVSPAGPRFLGIEVKYHEDLKTPPAADPDNRYSALALGTGAFDPSSLPALARPPLQQLWLDHLLALRLREVDSDRYVGGRFVLLYPQANTRCSDAAATYRQAVIDTTSWDARTLEEVVAAIRAVAGDAVWPEELYRRYLDLDQLDAPPLS